MIKNKEALLQSRVEPELLAQLKKALEDEGHERTVSQVVRSLVREFVRKNQQATTLRG